MAYRFNPPPNWPVDDEGWTPPPGWQPDPEWGPAPEGWNFWVADDETHVAGASSENEAVPEQSDSPVEDVSPTATTAPETAEYTGPSEEETSAALASAAPYESTERESREGDHAQDEGPQDERTAAPGIDGAQAPAGGASAYAIEDGQASPAAQGYGAGDQQSPNYGAQNYGAPGDGTQGYGAQGPASHDQSGAAQGQVPPVYAPSSPGTYGSPDPGPASNPQAQWSTVPNSAEPAKKGVIARFWWIGCIVLLLLAIIAVIGGIFAFRVIDSADDPSPSAGSATTQAAASEEPSQSDSTSAEPTVTPSVLPTVDPSAKEIDVVGPDGKGKVQVSMEWKDAKDLDTQYPIDDGKYGPYLVVTTHLKVTEGTMSWANWDFTVETPYGGKIQADSNTYALKTSGIGSNSPYQFSEGDEYSLTMLFVLKRAGGNKLTMDSGSDTYVWDIKK